MFSTLTDKITKIISSIKDKKLTEQNISDAVRRVRMALLDADVNYNVASDFVKKVKEKALGQQVIKSVQASDQFVHIVHTELVSLMGGEESKVSLKGSPASIMLIGLQGSGKTTACAKLAKYFLKKEPYKRILLAACDLQRPAAVDQLTILAKQISVDIFSIPGEKNPLTVAKQALAKAKEDHYELLIVDTAGRLHIDDDLMNELAKIKKAIDPSETLFIANATTGQDAVKVASEFDKRISITGSILTMLDGDARAGAALSIRSITNKPLKFEGVGEKIDDFQLFHPSSMADRILGMGDVINLVRKAEENIDKQDKEELEEKFRKASFTFNDYLKQISMVKKMGSFKSVMKMMPGASQLGDLDMPEEQFKETEAIILSMTPKERSLVDEMGFDRRRRVASGAGVKIDSVNRLLKGFKRTRQMMKKLPKMKDLADLKNMRKGSWR